MHIWDFERLNKHNFKSPFNHQLNNSYEKALNDSITRHIIWRKHFLADQCALNALFHENENKLAILPCHWNLRVWGVRECSAEKSDCFCPNLKQVRGCALLHGQGSTFRSWKNLPFATVWQTFNDASWEEIGNSSHLLLQIRKNLRNIDETKKDHPGLDILKICI
ncbi:unnamed protein product [Oikopleura dioica]|uniref:Uncharacterized protein n=1 Tax=Oikopleura dioica TaxID=34765 RepID=E4X1A5_OIKDI|nr:unnamed protein product [Oikopleura dioica]